MQLALARGCLIHAHDCLIHAQLTREVDKEAADAEDGEGEEMGKTSTTRSFVCEQQRLRVPATDAAATKLKDFHDQIVELKNAKAPRVAELIAKFSPGSVYKVMDEGKAILAHQLEKMCVADLRSPSLLSHARSGFLHPSH